MHVRRSLLAVAVLLLTSVGAWGRNDAAVVAWENGMSLWRQQDSNLYPQVAASFRRALAADPQNPDYHSCLGRILLDEGEIQDASAELRWCMGFRPYSTAVIVSTHLAQGQCWDLRGQTAKARQEYQKALSSHPGQALREEAVTRLGMTTWHRAVRSHCVICYQADVSPDVAASLAATCDATTARALTVSHVTLGTPIYVYLVRDAHQIGSLGVHPGDAREGRRQLYELANSDPTAWQAALVRIVSYHIAPTHSTDPIIRYGLWTLMSNPDAAASPPTGDLPTLSTLRQANTWDVTASSEAAMFVRYLITSYGADSFALLWAEPSSEKGAGVAYHKSMRDLEADWLSSLHPAPSSPPAPDSTSSGSPSPSP